jgi:hypothetical protein
MDPWAMVLSKDISALPTAGIETGVADGLVWFLRGLSRTNLKSG